MEKKTVFWIIGIIVVAVAAYFLVSYIQFRSQPFSISNMRILSGDVAQFNANGEIDVILDYETRGRVINLDFPLERRGSVKNVRANLECVIPGAVLFDSLTEEENEYVFESFPYVGLDFSLGGFGSFRGRGTVLNKGSTKGTEILLLKKNGLAKFSMDLDFDGQEAIKVDCRLDIISRIPAYVTSKNFVLNYPGIEGDSVLDD